VKANLGLKCLYTCLQTTPSQVHTGFYLTWPFATRIRLGFHITVARQCWCCYVSFICLFVCLFIGIKPGKLYSASCVGKEVNPLGVITHGQKHTPRAYQRQQYIPRTCQSMVNTLQVDGLARISGLTPALYKAHPQPPNGVPPCLVWRIGFRRGEG